MSKIVSTRKALHSSEYHERKKKENRFRSGLIAFILIVILVVPILLLRWEKFRVNDVTISGNVVVKEEEVRRVVEGMLSEKYLWLAPKDNDLLIPRRALKEKLFAEVPRIQSVDINLLDTKTLGINIVERTPSALYCIEQETEDLQDCYFLDESGFIFAKSPDFSGDVYFIYRGGEAGDNPIGKNYLPQETFEQLNKFNSDVSKLGISFKSFEFRPESTESKAQFRLYNTEDVPVFWYADESLEKIYSSLATLISSEILGAKSSPLNNILYLDLTIPNKPYWKSK